MQSIREVPDWILYCPTVFDWSIPDSTVDLDAYAEALLDRLVRARCGALAYVVDNGGYAIYDSRVMPKDPHVGDRDLLALLVEQTHMRGLKFVASWMNVHDQAYISRELKDWHQQTAAGESIVSLRNAPCLNSLAGDYFAAQFSEVASNYDIDGVYVEGNNVSSACYCTQCRARFEATYGYPIPEDAEELRRSLDFQRFRMETVTHHAHKLHRALARSGKQIPLMFCVSHTPGWDIERVSRHCEMVMTENHGNVGGGAHWEIGLRVEALKAESLAPVGNAAAWLSIFGDNDFQQMSPSMLKLSLFGTLMHQATPHVHPLNLFDYGEHLIPAYREHNDLQSRIRPYLVEGKRVAPVGVVVSYTDASLKDYSPSFVGYYEALTDAHVPFQVISERQVLRGEIENVDVIVLPDVLRMSDAFIEAVGGYLHDGGSVVATHRTGLWDACGSRREVPAVEQWAGIETFEIVVHPSSFERQRIECVPDRHYFRSNAEGLLGPDHAPDFILSFEGSRVEIEGGTGTESLATVLDFDYARTHATDRTWRFYPAGPVSDMIVSAAVGKGQLIYVAADIDRAYLVEGKGEIAQLLAALTRKAASQAPEIEVTDPEFGIVEMTAYRRGEDEVLILLRNRMTNQRWGGNPNFRSPLSWQKKALVNYVAPIHNLRVRLRDANRQISSCSAFTDAEVQCSTNEGWHEITLSHMAEAEAILVKLH